MRLSRFPSEWLVTTEGFARNRHFARTRIELSEKEKYGPGRFLHEAQLDPKEMDRHNMGLTVVDNIDVSPVNTVGWGKLTDNSNTNQTPHIDFSSIAFLASIRRQPGTFFIDRATAHSVVSTAYRTRKPDDIIYRARTEPYLSQLLALLKPWGCTVHWRPGRMVLCTSQLYHGRIAVPDAAPSDEGLLLWKKLSSEHGYVQLA